ncbi:hypothetical protein BS78_06G098400 [Paspalum vaginatum]|nr:hypothetical protein BS78_06G098400 [Paspalum vaginatum]
MTAVRGWSSLPSDLLREVSGRLSCERDLLHVRQVCCHWRSSASLPVAPYRPWVVASRARSNIVGPIGEHSLWLPRGLKRVHLAAAPRGLPYCYGAPRGGWLALGDDERKLALWEPSSGAVIPLPPLARVIQVFLSADPESSRSGWVAVASTQVFRDKSHGISFWRPGDAAWVAAAEVRTRGRLRSVAFLGDRMYCMDECRSFAIYDLSDFRFRTTGSPPALLRRNNATHLLVRLCNRRCGRHLHGTRGAQFVACAGQMLLVVMFNPSHPSFAEVYRQGSTPGQQLDLGERVTDLGGYSLFLGRGDAFALSPQEFPAVKGNCVYFVVHYNNPDIKDWVYVFDLQSDALEKFPFPQEHKEDPANEWWPVSWFCPKRPISS